MLNEIVMKLTKKQSKTIKKQLDRGSVAVIHEKIGYKIGCRAVQLILAGEMSDNHGVVDAALLLIEEKKKNQEELNSKLKIKQ